jgi:hypothetical protein
LLNFWIAVGSDSDQEGENAMKLNKPALFILLLVGLGTLAFTSYKIYTMAQIRGWLPGAKATTCTVTAKYEDVWSRIQRGGAFTLDCPNLQRVPGHRVQLSYELWLKIGVGTSIPIVRVGGLYGEELFVQNDLGSSDGDFAVDSMFLMGEVLVSLIALLGLFYKPRPTIMQELWPNSNSSVYRRRR